jgi:hypothetical protein
MPAVIATVSASISTLDEREEPIDSSQTRLAHSSAGRAEPVVNRARVTVDRPSILASEAAVAATSVAMVNDQLIIRQTLERYRNAYNGLDARSARAVYPAVNQAALARAFDGLQSQSLVFDACDMHVSGWSATATCHGSTRYAPKIGDRAPHTEPRVWSFTLSKSGNDWKIENARAAW